MALGFRDACLNSYLSPPIMVVSSASFIPLDTTSHSLWSLLLEVLIEEPYSEFSRRAGIGGLERAKIRILRRARIGVYEDSCIPSPGELI